MIFTTHVPFVTAAYEEVLIEIRFELTEDDTILEFKSDHEDEETLKEFDAAWLASPELQDRVDEACLDHALGRVH